MPKKLGFIVVSSSSHEDNFSAKELMVHAPTVNGWRSNRYVKTKLYFQELSALKPGFKSFKIICLCCRPTVFMFERLNEKEFMHIKLS